MRRVPWWVLAAGLLPLGLGAWTPLVPGLRMKRSWWVFWGALWTVISLAGWILAGGTDDSTDAGGLCVIIAWVGALATTLIIRPSYLDAVGSEFGRAREAAERRRRDREEARRMAAEEPELARDMGVGRPDRPGASDAGLVDVNNAAATALAALPGVDDALATRIVEVRAQINGFSSLADMGGVLDLDAHTVERLREHVVFLPR